MAITCSPCECWLSYGSPHNLTRHPTSFHQFLMRTTLSSLSLNHSDPKIAKMHLNAKRIVNQTFQQIEIEWEWLQISCFVDALLTIDVHAYRRIGIFDMLSDQTIKPRHERYIRIFHVPFKRIPAFLFISTFFSISMVFLFGFVAVCRLPTRHLS